jgi:hypothetical protein
MTIERDKNYGSSEVVADLVKTYHRSKENFGVLPALSQLYLLLNSTKKFTPQRRLEILNPLIADALNKIGRATLQAQDLRAFYEATHPEEKKSSDQPKPTRPKFTK